MIFTFPISIKLVNLTFIIGIIFKPLQFFTRHPPPHFFSTNQATRHSPHRSASYSSQSPSCFPHSTPSRKYHHRPPTFAPSADSSPLRLVPNTLAFTQYSTGHNISLFCWTPIFFPFSLRLHFLPYQYYFYYKCSALSILS